MTTDTVLKQIAALPKMETSDLQSLWEELYGDTPCSSSRDTIIRRLAYRIQEIAYGGLSGETKTKIKTMQKSHIVRASRKKDLLPPPGTKLIREYDGMEHRVTVLEDGFEYEGRKYKSLSEIARTITGTRWSGPKFFGLKS